MTLITHALLFAPITLFILGVPALIWAFRHH